MSIDTKFDEVIAALTANTNATAANTAILERVVAGQESALAKLGADAPRAKRETAAEKKAREAAEKAAGGATTGNGTIPAADGPVMLTTPANNETKLNDKQQQEPTPAWRASDFSEAQVKGEFIGWLGDTSDADERKARAAFIASIAQNFGVAKPFGPEGMKDDEQRQQALFYLRRHREGVPVDFAADYDFDDDPLQGASDAVDDAAAGGSDIDDLG